MIKLCDIGVYWIRVISRSIGGSLVTSCNYHSGDLRVFSSAVSKRDCGCATGPCAHTIINSVVTHIGKQVEVACVSSSNHHVSNASILNRECYRATLINAQCVTALRVPHTSFSSTIYCCEAHAIDCNGSHISEVHASALCRSGNSHGLQPCHRSEVEGYFGSPSSDSNNSHHCER